jgi:tryptophan halogenase
MHICIIGTGASGWIACTMLKKLKFIKKITIIGSSKIPTIGVGESTTRNFVSSVLSNVELSDFVRETDATVKYGVYYKNWSKNNFVNYFGSETEDWKTETVSLGNKDPNTHIHDLWGNKLWNFIQKNQVSLDKKEYRHSWHFDAGKFINFLKKTNLKDNKVNFIDDTIIDCKFLGDEIEYIIGESNQKYKSDYFINCCGNAQLNERIFREEYFSLSPYLLTNKAVVYPLEYANKRDQFHPYTIAKTMTHGWRWIIPTQTRIGTGYVFSDNHISVDEATNQFLEDIGNKTIEPSVVDFNPKCNQRTFKTNSCTIGMSNTFLEPLDASGLSLSIDALNILSSLLELKQENINYQSRLKIANNYLLFLQKFWCSFILHQYKTSWRNDTQFWIDHKNVKCDFYDKILNIVFRRSLTEDKFQKLMDNMKSTTSPSILFTTASKDIQWKTGETQNPIIIEQTNTETIHHLDYIQGFYD